MKPIVWALGQAGRTPSLAPESALLLQRYAGSTDFNGRSIPAV
jgi:hypothetical protein